MYFVQDNIIRFFSLNYFIHSFTHFIQLGLMKWNAYLMCCSALNERNLNTSPCLSSIMLRNLIRIIHRMVVHLNCVQNKSIETYDTWIIEGNWWIWNCTTSTAGQFSYFPKNENNLQSIWYHPLWSTISRYTCEINYWQYFTIQLHNCGMRERKRTNPY